MHRYREAQPHSGFLRKAHAENLLTSYSGHLIFIVPAPF